MIEVRTFHTSSLEARELQEIRRFLETPDDDDGIHVLPLAASLDLAGDLACDWRDGDVW